MSRLRAFLIPCLLAVALLSATVVDAQGGATVHVVVTDRNAAPADAWVNLRPREGEEGETHTCVTRNGTCDIRNVPPGSYVVTATPRGEGRPPLPRVVPVPEAVPAVEVRVRLL